MNIGRQYGSLLFMIDYGRLASMDMPTYDT